MSNIRHVNIFKVALFRVALYEVTSDSFYRLNDPSELSLHSGVALKWLFVLLCLTFLSQRC
jgi:hypothetical protein